MQSRILFLLFLSFNFCLLSSQVPQGFNYQAIARDGTGAILANQSLTARISIQTLITGGTLIWEETHSVTTNQFGAMVFVIGGGTRTGGSVSLFSEIDWKAQTHFLKTEVDPGTGYLEMGTTQLWSVPYSLVANELSGSIDKLLVKGSSTSLTDALFEVKNTSGQTIFAVYNEGVRVFIDNGLAKSPKGGFAIGSFGTDKKGKTETQRLLYVKSDTIRMYIDDVSKAPKGGFAIGGFGEAKSMTDNYLKVDLEKIQAGKVQYINLTPLNTFIGDQAGKLTVPSGDNGSYNSFIGYQSGYNNTSGHHNTYIGWKAGFNVGANAHYNIFIGNSSGYNNTGSSNIFIGDNSGNLNTTGNQNVFLGALAGEKNVGGNNNMFIGSGAGRRNSSGGSNTFLGTSAGEWNIAGSFNTFIGWLAGGSNNSTKNVMIGTEAGSLSTSEGNVFIGYNAGYYETNSNRLYISNAIVTNLADGKTKALIYGEFDNKIVTINDVLKLTPRSSPPASPTEGTIYVDSSTHTIKCYLNGGWKTITAI